MSLKDYLSNQEARYSPAHGKKKRHPKGWEPGIEMKGNRGEITVGPLESRPKTWDEVLEIWDLDPETVEVIEPVEFRAWDAAIGGGEVRRMYYYKIKVRQRTTPALDAEQIIEELADLEVPEPFNPEGKHTFVVAIADPQLGKPDGDGTKGTVRRWERANLAVPGRVAELRSLGYELRDGMLLNMGDILENCDGHYDMQTFGVELSLREQKRTARRLLGATVKHLVSGGAFDRVVAVGVGGNHGEVRKGGKAYTDFGDNYDVALMDELYDMVQYGENEELIEKVSFVIPETELSLTLDVAGHVVGLAHGHQAKKGGSLPEQKIDKWFSQMSKAKHPIGDSEILITAHFHHLIFKDMSPVMWLQCPTLDGGSQWFEEGGGGRSAPGVATFTIGPEGIDNLKVL